MVQYNIIYDSIIYYRIAFCAEWRIESFTDSLVIALKPGESAAASPTTGPAQSATCQPAPTSGRWQYPKCQSSRKSLGAARVRRSTLAVSKTYLYTSLACVIDGSLNSHCHSIV